MTNTCCDKCISKTKSYTICINEACECHLVSAWELPDDPLKGDASYVELETTLDIVPKEHPSDGGCDELYCKTCGGCGEVGCDGIATFLNKHVRGKTNCLYEESYIEDVIEMYKEQDNHFFYRDSLRREVEEYLGHIQNDGSGKPMNISLEEIGQDLIRLIDQK